MDGIYYVKNVGNLDNFETKNGERNDKLTLVISTKEIRSSENGLYTADQDFCVNVYGKTAREFNLKPGDWLCGTLRFTVREGQNDIKFQDISLTRYLKL